MMINTHFSNHHHYYYIIMRDRLLNFILVSRLYFNCEYIIITIIIIIITSDLCRRLNFTVNVYINQPSRTPILLLLHTI